MDDSQHDSHDDSRWLTYDEIATVRGVKRSGAIRWVQRHKWRRQPGNDGQVRALVPNAWLRSRQSDDSHADSRRDTASDTVALVEAERRRADDANRRADVALALVADANARADRAEARADAAEQAARKAQEAADELLHAEEARKARGRWARLRSAWRGE